MFVVVRRSRGFLEPVLEPDICDNYVRGGRGADDARSPRSVGKTGAKVTGFRDLRDGSKSMAKRPEIFDQDAFEQSLREQGCAESFIKPITSDFRLFVPVALRYLGRDRLFEIVNAARTEFRLGEQTPAWQEAAKYIVGWAEEQLDEYKNHKL
jgi:hypothetical protein